MEIYKEFTFEAAHHLPNVPRDHKCGRLHGHSYKVRVYLSGDVCEQAGWVIDFGDVSAVVKPVIEQLDHYYLNQIPGIYNPTSENVAIWIYEKIKPSLQNLSAVQVCETCTSGVIYRPE